MVKKRNLKRLLAVVLSFAMAIQPTSLVFAEGENTGETATQSDVTISIETSEEENGTITTSLNGEALVANVKERVKVRLTSPLDGKEDVTDEVKDSITLKWTEVTSQLDGQESEQAPTTTGEYKVKAALSQTTNYKAAESTEVTVIIESIETPPVDDKIAVAVILKSSHEMKLGDALEPSALVEKVSPYDGEGLTSDQEAEICDGLKWTWVNAENETFNNVPAVAGDYTVSMTFDSASTEEKYDVTVLGEVSVTISDADKIVTYIEITGPEADVNEGSDFKITVKVTALDGEGKEIEVDTSDEESLTYYWSKVVDNNETSINTKPTEVGTYRVYVVYKGNDTYLPSTSNILEIVIKKVEAKPLTVTLREGQKVELGKINKDDLVETVTAYNGEADNNMLLTGNARKEVVDKLAFTWIKDDKEAEEPTETGKYTVSAKYKADDKYDAAESNVVEVEVIEVEQPDPDKEALKISAKDVVTTYNGTELTADVAGALAEAAAVDSKDEKVDVDFTYTWKELKNNPKNAGEYVLVIAPEDEERYTGSKEINVTIEKVQITVSANDLTISENEALPTPVEGVHFTTTGTLAETDKWAVEPTVEFAEDCNKVAGLYEITAKAEVDGAAKDNYEIKTVNAVLTVQMKSEKDETGKELVKFAMVGVSGNEISVSYNGSVVTLPEIRSLNPNYKSEPVKSWKTKQGYPVDENGPKDAGTYILTVKVDEKDTDFTGSTDFIVEISPKDLTVSVIVEDIESPAGELVGYCLEDDAKVGFVAGETWVLKPSVKVSGNSINKENSKYQLVPFGGEPGKNYKVKDYLPSEVVTTTAAKKPVIEDAHVQEIDPKGKLVYTGEAIQPAVKVVYTYTDAKGKAKKAKLKLNVDYTVTYRDNVNHGTATAIIEGIGEYAGYVTKEFEIKQKDIKKAVISPVGDTIVGEEPVVVVMDGIYELEEGIDYERLYDGKSTMPSEAGQVTLTIRPTADGNYIGTSKKKAKFNIVTGDVKPIKDAVVVEKEKTLTYNGKAQKKPIKSVTVNGEKLKSKNYKVIYTNNVNATTSENMAYYRIVGVSKKGVGYYGTTEPMSFKIEQKDFGKVKASNITIPKVSALDGVTLSVKDGKRILVEGKDYEVKDEGGLNSVIRKAISENAKSCTLTIGPKSGDGNYVENSSKTVKIKFSNLNLASKTAKVEIVSQLNGSAEVPVDKEHFDVMYNGVRLTAAANKTGDGDYYIVKTDDRKHTVKIAATKNSVYKGSATITDERIK